MSSRWSVAPIELVLGCAGGPTPGNRLFTRCIVTDAVSEDSIGEHHDMIVGDSEVGVPPGGRIEGTRELLADLVGALIGSLEVEEGPDLRLIGGGTLSDRSTAAGIRTGRS